MINALKYVEELEQTGFTSEQAKMSVATWLELMNDNLVTKNDLKEHQLATKLEFAAVRHEMKEEFAAVRHEMKEEFATVRHKMNELNVTLSKRIDDLDNKFKNLEYRLVIKLGALMATLIGLLGLYLDFIVKN